nr:hypothetical protein [Burkholderia multivorans]
MASMSSRLITEMLAGASRIACSRRLAVTTISFSAAASAAASGDAASVGSTTAARAATDGAAAGVAARSDVCAHAHDAPIRYRPATTTGFNVKLAA